jgi:hypothetical protein
LFICDIYFLFFICLVFYFLNNHYIVFTTFLFFNLLFNNVLKDIISVSTIYQYITFYNSSLNFIIIINYVLLFFFLKNYNYSIYMLSFFLTLNVFYFNFFDIFVLDKGSINTNLLNGLMLIHPIVLFLFYSFLFSVLLYFFFLKTFFFFKNFFFFIKKKYNYFFIYCVFPIILGCLWAEQELAWCSWWSWDLIEIISLTYLFFILFCIHTYKFINVFFIKIFLLFFFESLVLVRYNIINSIHNFVLTQIQNQFILFLIFFIYVVIFFFFKTLTFSKRKHSNSFVFFFIFYQLFILFVIFSNFFLIKNFLFIYISFFSIKYYTSLVLIYSFVLLFNDFKFKLLTLFFFKFKFVDIIFFNFLKFFFLKKFRFLHFCCYFVFSVLLHQQIFYSYFDFTYFFETIKLSKSFYFDSKVCYSFYNSFYLFNLINNFIVSTPMFFSTFNPLSIKNVYSFSNFFIESTNQFFFFYKHIKTVFFFLICIPLYFL